MVLAILLVFSHFLRPLRTKDVIHPSFKSSKHQGRMINFFFFAADLWHASGQAVGCWERMMFVLGVRMQYQLLPGRLAVNSME
jgi:hypothetical protein